MSTAHPKAFCARPGCRVAYAVHGRLATACAGYIDPSSSAGVAIRRAEKQQEKAKRAHLSVVETPVPEPIEDEPTAKVPTLSDAQLLAEWKARATEIGVLA